MTGRERLPSRRPSETFGFRCDGRQHLATVSRFRDRRNAEILNSDGRTGSNLDYLARDAAIVASLAFHYGAPVSGIRHARHRDHRGRTITPLGVAFDYIGGIG